MASVKYNGTHKMAERENGSQVQKQTTLKTAKAYRPEVSDFGRRLRQLSDKAIASGTPTLSHDQIRRLLSEVRG
jgi:hypothetical protein